METLRRMTWAVLLATVSACCQEQHDHGIPEKLGRVSFPISCTPEVQPEFDRAVALLHSFAYSAAKSSFEKVATDDPSCAMAHWGMAMTQFHQLWEPRVDSARWALGEKEIALARATGTTNQHERHSIDALALIFDDAERVPYPQRALKYADAMGAVARENEGDVEAQVFYALALLSTAPPSDKTHANQKRAIAILEPLWAKYPDHPGIPHYLIHACDNAELASHGLKAARAYALIAPSAPHALHMPSHIFTQLGLWEDSIQSNLAAAKAASEQGDVGEQLHAMDYLVYAYLQLGRSDDARGVIGDLQQIQTAGHGDFKASYAATAMPARFAIEQRHWAEAEAIHPTEGVPPQVAAIAVWARGVGLTRGEKRAQPTAEIEQLGRLRDQLAASDSPYWSEQTGILQLELMAWSAEAQGEFHEAERQMRQAAEKEDAVEKLPVTPGAIVPAREQLGDLLLEQKEPAAAAVEFKTAAQNTPGRRGTAQGLATAKAMGAR